MLFRQGDVYLQKVDQSPVQETKLVPLQVIAYGEVTGHRHEVQPTSKTTTLEWSEQMTEEGRVQFLKVQGGNAVLYHGSTSQIEKTKNAPKEFDHIAEDTHAPITLEPGVYKFWIQREYNVQEYSRTVLD